MLPDPLTTALIDVGAVGAVAAVFFWLYYGVRKRLDECIEARARAEARLDEHEKRIARVENGHANGKRRRFFG